MQWTVLWIPKGAFCRLDGGGARHIGTSLTVSSLWHCLGHSQASLQCHFSRCKVGSFKGGGGGGQTHWYQSYNTIDGKEY